MLEKQVKILEEKIKRFVYKKKYPIILFVVLVLLIILTTFIPYLNLFINIKLIFFLIVSSGLIVFKVSVEKIMVLGVILFVIMIPLVLFKEFSRAEYLADLEYGFIFVSLISYFIRSGRDGF